MKIADPDPYFFLFRIISNLLFWSYGPLKFFENNCEQDISQSIFRLVHVA